MKRASGPDASIDPNAIACDVLDLADVECSDLAPVLATYIRGHVPGTLVCVRTLKPSAIEGVRSWCRLTGHQLEREEPLTDAIDFFIRRKSSTP